MRGGGAKFTLLVLLVLAAACGSRRKAAPAGSASGAPAVSGAEAGAGAAAADEATLRQQLAERDREIVRLRNQVQEAQARENDMRASLEEASRRIGGDAAGSSRGGVTGSGGGGASGASDERPDVVLAALRAALSQEQERRELVENQLNRLKEETSASYIGPRVPEADYLAVKQELVLLRQSLADERAAHDHPSAGASASAVAAADPAAQAAIAESADLRVRLKHLQEERDTIVASLNNNLMASQQRVTQLEQELTVSRAATTHAEAAAAATGLSAENATLRAQLDEERRRAQDLTAKLKLAARVNDLIFKIQAQHAEDELVRPKRPHQ